MKGKQWEDDEPGDEAQVYYDFGNFSLKITLILCCLISFDESDFVLEWNWMSWREIFVNGFMKVSFRQRLRS